jgi:hypothetical protein
MKSPGTANSAERERQRQPTQLSEEEIQQLMHRAIRFVDRLRFWGFLVTVTGVALLALFCRLLS